ncbi:hypothetical protein AYL99_10686 [Fonsecaea erecta]|uniref:Uncharacterized protein n=1 Tax=Fonsecaea erecta TaxID=1367422 RepID=A0A178Z698_9EURO|nr:hypothetical protein AYL99_10686 [Fonsecaea erecta]OAP54986.1 hypothetical protein AYL99_10686 [Fonsecaea erecta]
MSFLRKNKKQPQRPPSMLGGMEDEEDPFHAPDVQMVSHPVQAVGPSHFPPAPVQHAPAAVPAQRAPAAPAPHMPPAAPPAGASTTPPQRISIPADAAFGWSMRMPGITRQAHPLWPLSPRPFSPRPFSPCTGQRSRTSRTPLASTRSWWWPDEGEEEPYHDTLAAYHGGNEMEDDGQEVHAY